MEHHLGFGRDPDLPLEILDRYLARTATAEEVEAVRQWLERNPAEATALERLQATVSYAEVEELSAVERSQLVRRAMGQMGSSLSVVTPERAVSSIRETRHQPFGARAPRARLQPGFARHWGWYAAAALVVGVLGVIGGWDGHAHGAIGNAPRTMSTYVTANGERANITLPDGATVMLDVASRLDVPADYAAGNHGVHLWGQAFFTVQKQSESPFTVTAGGTTARVLGTSFVVRHYDTDTSVTVAVQSGKVSVGSVVVTAARLIEVHARGRVRLGTADASRFAFTSGVLHLSSMPLAQAIPELNRWYGADIRLSDSSFARIPIKGTFAAGSLSDVTEMLKFMLDARVVRDGRVLTLYPKGSN
jgi:ferric-dicitrate binding protein FerR (iron transport regulator)